MVTEKSGGDILNGFVHKVKNLTRKQGLGYFLFFFLLVTSIVIVDHNYSFYDRPIAEVTQATLVETTPVTDRHGNKDTLYKQDLTAILKNGETKGQPIYLKNEYSSSGAFDQEYRVGNELFVYIEDASIGKSKLTGIVTDVKRDKHALIIAWIFIFVLLVVGKKQGLFAIISFAINVLILSIALDFYVKYANVNLLVISGICILLFTVISLLFVSGFNEKTYAAIVATLVATFTSLGITTVVLWMLSDNGLRYEEMQFLTRPYRLIFISGLFIGSLGAIMDIAITLSSSIFALYEKNAQISIKALRESGMNIGREIMGTITNILFLAYVCGSIPMLLLSFKNATPLGFTFSMNLSLEIARALSGGIGIVLTIPIGVYTSLFFINRKRGLL